MQPAAPRSAEGEGHKCQGRVMSASQAQVGQQPLKKYSAPSETHRNGFSPQDSGIYNTCLTCPTFKNEINILHNYRSNHSFVMDGQFNSGNHSENTESNGVFSRKQGTYFDRFELAHRKGNIANKLNNIIYKLHKHCKP